jgi:hypothetical protein
MAELLDILDAFPMPLKIGWVVWFAWGIGQIFWYRHDRTSSTASKRPSAPLRRPFVSKPSMPQRAGTRLITPEPVLGKEPPAVEPSPVDPPHPGPAPALLEVSDQVAELDRFVADFEMNTRHRRGGPLNGEPAPFGGHSPHSA